MSADNNDAGMARQREIAALGSLAPGAEAVARLRSTVAAYGKVTSVSLMPAMAQADPDTYIFLVDFERREDAIAASCDLRCHLFGLTTLVVPVARPPKDATQA